MPISETHIHTHHHHHYHTYKHKHTHHQHHTCTHTKTYNTHEHAYHIHKHIPHVPNTYTTQRQDLSSLPYEISANTQSVPHVTESFITPSQPVTWHFFIPFFVFVLGGGVVLFFVISTFALWTSDVLLCSRLHRRLLYFVPPEAAFSFCQIFRFLLYCILISVAVWVWVLLGAFHLLGSGPHSLVSAKAELCCLPRPWHERDQLAVSPGRLCPVPLSPWQTAEAPGRVVKCRWPLTFSTVTELAWGLRICVSA